MRTDCAHNCECIACNMWGLWVRFSIDSCTVINALSYLHLLTIASIFILMRCNIKKVDILKLYTDPVFFL